MLQDSAINVSKKTFSKVGFSDLPDSSSGNGASTKQVLAVFKTGGKEKKEITRKGKRTQRLGLCSGQDRWRQSYSLHKEKVEEGREGQQ